MTRWILISDASRARLFRTDDRAAIFTLLASFEHPKSRARVRELMADVNGRKPAGIPMAGSHGNQPRPGAAPDTDAKEVEAQKFARELASYLQAGLHGNAYDSLVIAGPPHFLGVLKHMLSGEIKKKVELALNKDLTQTQKTEIENHVRSELSL